MQAPLKNFAGCELRQAKQASILSLRVGQYLFSAAAHCCGVRGDPTEGVADLLLGGSTLHSSKHIHYCTSSLQSSQMVSYNMMTWPVDLEYTGCPNVLSCFWALQVSPPLCSNDR